MKALPLVLMLIVSMAHATTAPTPATPSKVPGREDKVLLKSLTFVAPVNVKAFTIKGEASQLAGVVKRKGDLLESVQITIPIESLTTHLELRDTHMREKIFQTTDGKLPALQFVGSGATCTPADANSKNCEVAGKLTVRGETRDFRLAGLMSAAGEHLTLKFKGTIKLSDFGIPAPSYLGVKVSNDVLFEGEVQTQ